MRKIITIAFVIGLISPGWLLAETSANKKADDDLIEGDVIEVVGIINPESTKGIYIRTNCLRLDTLKEIAFLTKDNDTLENLKGRSDGCYYSIGNPSITEQFSFDFVKLSGKKVSMLAKVCVYDNTGKIRDIPSQLVPGKIVYLYPLKIEEIK